MAKPRATVLIALSLLLGLGALGYIKPESKEFHGRRLPNHNSLRLLALALHSYHYECGTLPGPAIYDATGNPLLSWRVALLPYLGEKSLYEQFYLDEAWDSDHNLPLLQKMPKLFAHFRRPEDAAAFKTNFLAIVGKGAAFEQERALRMPGDFPDGLSNTIMLAETPIAVPWTKPEDLAYDAASPLPAMGGSTGGFLVALADGSVRKVPEKISEATVRAAITRNGGEELGPDW